MITHDLIHASARIVNYIASGEELPGADLQDAFSALNQFMDALGAERLAIFTLARQVFNLTANKQTYTMGTGGDFNVPRPPKIEYCSIISNANPAQPVELAKKNLLTDREWQEIRAKNISSPLPTQVYDDGSFPTRNISVWPVPSDSTPQLALYTWSALSQFTLDNTDYLFPPGYLEAIKYNFAKRLAAEWPGTVFSAQADQLAREGMARIKNFNAPIIKARCDVTTGGDSQYNYLIDQ